MKFQIDEYCSQLQIFDQQDKQSFAKGFQSDLEIVSHILTTTLSGKSHINQLQSPQGDNANLSCVDYDHDNANFDHLTI